MAVKKVLHVDDDPAVLRTVAGFLGTKGIAVVSTSNPFVAPMIVAERPDVIIMDVDMPLLPGDRIVAIMRTHDFSTTPVVFFSAKPESRLATISATIPGSSYVMKEAGLPALFDKICSAVAP